MEIGRLVINRTGGVHLERETQAVTKKASKVDFYSRQGGRSYKVGSMSYEGYTGLSHDVTLTRKPCTQILPISKITWDYWMSTPPSYGELGKLAKGRKTQIKTFLGQSEYLKALAHARDLVIDLAGEDCEFRLEFN